MRIVYAKRQSNHPGQEWFSTYTAYAERDPEMFRSIAFHLSDGSPEEESFDLAIGSLEQPPEDGVEPFDLAHADTGFGSVRVYFEEHGVEYSF